MALPPNGNAADYAYLWQMLAQSNQNPQSQFDSNGQIFAGIAGSGNTGDNAIASSNPADDQRMKLELARDSIRLKELELQIAAEKRKEREAELELARLRNAAPQTQSVPQQQQQQQPAPSQAPGAPSNLPTLSDADFVAFMSMYGLAPPMPQAAAPPIPSTLNGMTTSPQLDFPYSQPTFASSSSSLQVAGPSTAANGWSEINTALTAIDAQGFLAPSDMPVDSQTFDDILSELLANDPTYLPPPGTESAGDLSQPMQEESSPQDDELIPGSVNASPPEDSPSRDYSGSGGTTAVESSDSPDKNSSGASIGGGSIAGPPSVESFHTVESVSSSPAKHSHMVSLPQQIPTTRRSKKLLVEHMAVCEGCNEPIAKLLLRGTRQELDDEFDIHYLCAKCAPPVPVQVGGRKRVKQTEDTTLPTVCDVCLRTRGRGGIVPRHTGTQLLFAVEVVCLPCTEKYKRCSDCGGGSGRLGVGKWRCKELFDDGRKTCNLSHARLGTGELELAVWEVPAEVEHEAQIDQVLDACESFWRENVLRMAVPEILDSDIESPLQLRTFQDIQQKILVHGWPAKDHIMEDTSGTMKKYLALTWAKTRPRRGKTSTIAERTGKVVRDDNWLFGNIRRTKIFYPAGCMLVGIWFSHWDIDRRTIHLATTCPFDPGDVEDRSVVSIAETINRIVTIGSADPASSMQPPSHVWITYNEISPVIEQRVEDTLIKKKGFFPLDEYVQRFPDVRREDFVEPTYTRVVNPAQWRGKSGKVQDTPVHVLVKSLGKSMNWYRLQKIKMQEMHEKRVMSQLVRKRKQLEDAASAEERGVGKEHGADGGGGGAGGGE